MAPTIKFLPLIFLLSLYFTTPIISGEEEDCVYTIFIRTGSIIKGGTDSIIGLKLYDNFGLYIYIENLESWGGLMEQGHNYFERGNLDIFSGRGACLNGPVCAVNVTSDGSGAHHGWYVNYVEVTSTGVHKTCNQKQFTVEQWIATDTSPYQLWAQRDYCGNQSGLGLGLRLARPKTKVVDDVGSRSGYSILDSGVHV